MNGSLESLYKSNIQSLLRRNPHNKIPVDIQPTSMSLNMSIYINQNILKWSMKSSTFKFFEVWGENLSAPINPRWISRGFLGHLQPEPSPLPRWALPVGLTRCRWPVAGPGAVVLPWMVHRVLRHWATGGWDPPNRWEAMGFGKNPSKNIQK